MKKKVTKKGSKAKMSTKTKPNNPWGIKTGRLANANWEVPDFDFSLWTYGGIEN